MEAVVRDGAFVDTSAWFALADRDDRYHADATRRIRLLAGQGRPLVTTNFVVSETYTLARRRLGFADAWRFLQSIRSTSLARIVYVPESWDEDVERLLAQYDDQVFSYVDATSFVTMRRLGIQDAFAFDRDFLIAGFTLLDNL